MAADMTDFGSDLLDLTQFSLNDLDDLGERDHSCLAHAVRRIVDDSDSAPVAGFASLI